MNALVLSLSLSFLAAESSGADRIERSYDVSFLVDLVPEFPASESPSASRM